MRSTVHTRTLGDTENVFSAEELARLRGFPEINRAELIRYFTLTGADEAIDTADEGMGRIAFLLLALFAEMEHTSPPNVPRMPARSLRPRAATSAGEG